MRVADPGVLVAPANACDVAAWTIEAGHQPLFTGSPPIAKTIGMSALAAFAARAAGTGPATIAATLRLIGSAAIFGRRSY